MKCPKCGGTLSLKTIHTNQSGSIDVDFCKSCGGIFFDKGEVNRVPKEEVRHMAEEITETDIPTASGTGSCPKCGADLKRYFGESVPSDVHVLRCPECSGTWFEADELKEFKKAQDAKINYFKTWRLPMSSLTAVLIPIAVLIVLTGSTVITVQELDQASYRQARASEVIGAPSVVPGTDLRSAVIVFTTSEPARTEVVFDYGNGQKAAVIPASDEFATVHQALVNNLDPQNTYSYAIKVVTAEDSFLSGTYEFELE